MTRVGYGDYYLTSEVRRALVAILAIAGVGLFGIFTRYLSSSFILHQTDEQDDQLGATTLDPNQLMHDQQQRHLEAFAAT